MIELKKKALGGIKDMLSERMSERLKPKAVAVEVETVGMKPEEGMDPSAESPVEGMDAGGLTPEEKVELARLLEKAGCQ